jgi:hypothetical protein
LKVHKSGTGLKERQTHKTPVELRRRSDETNVTRDNIISRTKQSITPLSKVIDYNVPSCMWNMLSRQKEA